MAAQQHRRFSSQKIGDVHTFIVALNCFHVGINRQRPTQELCALLAHRFKRSGENAHQDGIARMDMERFAEIGRRHRVKTLIDATFATPYNQRPLEFGIDIVLHSATKYLGGHNDLLAGAILGSVQLVDGIRSLQHITGAVIDPLGAYLLIRGLKTFALRVARQNVNAQAVAEFLAAHPKVTAVHYAGLASHPHHVITDQQGSGGES